MDKALETIRKSKDELIEIGTKIWEKPEIRFEEHSAHALLTNFLEKQGFAVERGYCKLPTAFRAKWVTITKMGTRNTILFSNHNKMIDIIIL